MEVMQGLQEAIATSRAEQEHIQLDLAASQARNEELCRANEELRCGMRNHPGNCGAEDRECFTPPRDIPMPFSQSIMEAVIPPTFVGPKVTLTGMEDPEAHLTAFHTQMMLVGGSDAIRCKLFMSTLAGMAMDWFINLLDGHVKQAPPPVSYDLFDVKQYQGETLKEYINRFGAQVVKDLIVVPNIADRLRVPAKTDKVLGPHKDAWCEFHQAFGHSITNCLALGNQLDELVKSGYLNDYLVGSSGVAALAAPVEDQAHEMPIHGEVHTISGGFSGEGCTGSQRKRYVRSVNSVAAQEEDDSLDVDLAFTRADLRDVVPHDNDPVVISVVTAGSRVHRVLVDQGSLADVMF
ncbi:uncharacterized protein [Phaseolus vulgaris]|uniref:uncharacterized protein n=1 Tax=Phaseolus vulgaris TaxID=3885 RepID=UPI0035CC5789